MQKFAEQFEKVISSSPIVLSSHIEKQFGPTWSTLYIRGSLLFIDSSVLEIALFSNKSSYGVTVDKYRFQYMSADGQTIFRYDNAPHRPEIPSFPHHKHAPDKVIPSLMPSIQDLLNEISVIILQKHT